MLLQLEWNTGRLYAKSGQPIKAAFDGEWVVFKDCARLIIGQFQLEDFEKFDRETVMLRYDTNTYDMGPTKETWELQKYV